MTKKTSNTRTRYKNTVFRLNISFLRQDIFGVFPILGKNVKREPNLSPKLEALKGSVLELIWHHQKHKGLDCYTIAWQTHQSNGLAHLDILLKYDNCIQKYASSFDYLLPLCPQDLELLPDKKPRINITGYSLKKINQAVLEYGQKEDPKPFNTFTHEQSVHHLILAAIKKDPFDYFNELMKKDPYNFDLSYYSQKYNLIKAIPHWSAVKAKMVDAQTASKALIQQSKPGIQHISRQLIEKQLTSEELAIFDKHPCFQIIVNHLNQIPKYGPARPHKTLNLWLYGPKGIGKTSFLGQGPVNLKSLVPTYDMNMQNKYLNRYYNHVYSIISWNQAKYSDFSPTFILKLFQGLPVQIPIRYSSNIKRDNPLIIATSNMSLTSQIERRFKDQPHLITMAKSNLLNERIVEVQVPVPMFFMQKLLVPNDLTNLVNNDKLPGNT